MRPALSAIQDPRGWWKYICIRVIKEECNGGDYCPDELALLCSAIKFSEGYRNITVVHAAVKEVEDAIVDEKCENGDKAELIAFIEQDLCCSTNECSTADIIDEVGDSSGHLGGMIENEQETKVVANGEEEQEQESEVTLKDTTPVATLNPFAETNEHVVTVEENVRTTNPFAEPSADVVSENNSTEDNVVQNNETNPFADNSALKSDTVSPPQVSSSSNPFDSPLPTSSPTSNPFDEVDDNTTALKTIPTPGSRRMPLPGDKGKSASERNLAVPVPTSRSSMLQDQQQQSDSNSIMYPRPSAGSRMAVAMPLADVQQVRYGPDECKLIVMGFAKKEVENACLINRQEFKDALASISTVILENIRFERSVKHIFQPPLEIRVGSWMPAQSGSSNHIIFYIKVTVRGLQGFSYTVEKTYPDFLQLKKDFSTPIFKIIPSGLQNKFEDSRSWFKNDTEEVLNERRDMLDKWLRSICRLPELMIDEKIHNILFQFLDFEENVDVSRLL
jgi:hypothetical protein